MNTFTKLASIGIAAIAIAGCANQQQQRSDAEYLKIANEIMVQDFHSKGIATLDRLNQDALQSICSTYDNNPPPDLAKKLEAEELKSVKWPGDGVFMGSWAAGEKLAQSGRGGTWSDNADPKMNGGNCYNCHQLAAKELSFGTLGPSLYQFGKIRGGATEANLKYVWSKIYNGKAYNLCSNMPRFGHKGLLTENQIRDLVALLLDPESPVNK